MSLIARCLEQPDPAYPLRLLSGDQALAVLATPSGGTARPLQVVACCSSPWDDVPATAYPRIPGGVFAARDPTGRLMFCAGYLPCGVCAPCRAGLHLACTRPTRPGWNSPGGFATSVLAPSPFLAPAAFPVDAVDAVALLAAAGQTYQAQAGAGMAPGDAVVVFGPVGPGALPLQVLAAAGLRVVWVCPEEQPPSPLPTGVEHCQSWSGDDDLPAARCHLLDLATTPASVEQWLPVARLCVSCTLAGPVPSTVQVPLHRLLDGQVAVRSVRDLHPHLVLDLLGLLLAGRVSAHAHAQPLSFDDLLGARVGATGEHDERGRWAVLVP